MADRLLAIRGGLVLDASGSRLEPADVVVEDGRIAAVGPAAAVPAGAETIDASRHLVLPGLINAHTHAHNNLSRGLAERWTLEDQLNHGPALLTGRTPEDHYLSTAIGAIEMLRTGCTTAFDLFMALPAPVTEGVEAVARAYADVGMRAVIAPAVADIPFHQTVPGLVDLLPHDLRLAVEGLRPAPVDGLLRLMAETVRRWDGFASGRIRTAIAPTIPGQCTDEFLDGCRRLVLELGVPLHTHLAETAVQVVHGRRRWGRTIVSQLDRAGLLGAGFVGAHGVWVTAEDIRRLAGAGASVVHNPTSNLRVGSGIAPVRDLLDGGVVVGLGSDGSISSDNQDLFEAMRFAALVSRVDSPQRQERWLDAAEVWHMATAANARVVGMAADLGAVAPGRLADLVLLRRDSIFLQPLPRPLAALVYAENGSAVDTVVVDGRVALRHGRVVGVDEAGIVARAVAAAERLTHANQREFELARRLTPFVRAACRAAVAQPAPPARPEGVA